MVLCLQIHIRHLSKIPDFLTGIIAGVVNVLENQGTAGIGRPGALRAGQRAYQSALLREYDHYLGAGGTTSIRTGGSQTRAGLRI